MTAPAVDKETLQMKLTKIAATAAMTAGLGAVTLGIGSGTASADDFEFPDIPGIPFIPDDLVGPGPGVLPPPGHIGQIIDVPPGHWDDFLPVQVPGLPGLINHL
jgi:hypothetical protein